MAPLQPVKAQQSRDSFCPTIDRLRLPPSRAPQAFSDRSGDWPTPDLQELPDDPPPATRSELFTPFQGSRFGLQTEVSDWPGTTCPQVNAGHTPLYNPHATRRWSLPRQRSSEEYTVQRHCASCPDGGGRQRTLAPQDGCGTLSTNLAVRLSLLAVLLHPGPSGQPSSRLL